VACESAFAVQRRRNSERSIQSIRPLRVPLFWGRWSSTPSRSRDDRPATRRPADVGACGCEPRVRPRLPL